MPGSPQYQGRVFNLLRDAVFQAGAHVRGEVDAHLLAQRRVQPDPHDDCNRSRAAVLAQRLRLGYERRIGAATGLNHRTPNEPPIFGTFLWGIEPWTFCSPDLSPNSLQTTTLTFAPSS